MSDDMYVTWGDHRWLERKARHFELDSGQSIFQRRCTRCGRDFVVDRSSGARHAIHVSIFIFNLLHDEVTERWLREPCPGKRLPSDDGDRKKHAAELRISWERSREQSPASHHWFEAGPGNQT